MKGAQWAALLEEEQEEYRANLLWDDNGIIRNEGSTEYPWTCEVCSKHKQFGSLLECEPHCETEAHRNALWWTYEAKGHKAPVVPRWSTRRAEGTARDQPRSRRERPPISGGTPPRPALSGSPPSAADSRDRPSTASAGNWSYTVSLHNATLNGVRIDGAFLTVTIPCAMEPPPGATFEMDAAMIYGDIRQAHSSSARGPSPFVPLSQMGAGDLVVDGSSSLRRSMTQPEPASATSDTPVPVSSWQATNGRLLPGMTMLFTYPKQPPRPWSAYPKPPPPCVPRSAPAGASGHSAASVRADEWREQCRREDDGEQDSSGS